MLYLMKLFPQSVASKSIYSYKFSTTLLHLCCHRCFQFTNFSSSLGAATVTAPATWLNRDLPVYFTRTASNAVRTPTRAITSSTAGSASAVLPKGAIAGIAVGGAAVIVLMALGCFLCLRGRRRQSPALPQVLYTGSVATMPYSPSQHSAAPYSPQYPQQSQDMPELPETSHIPEYMVEPKYDSALTQAYRNGSIQEHNPQSMEGIWAQPQPSPHSPQRSQHYYPSPTHSPPPSALTPVRPEPAELGGSRPSLSAYSSPASYKVRRPVTPGSERYYQYPQYS